MSSLGQTVNEDRWFSTTRLYRMWPSLFNAADLGLKCQEIRLVKRYSNHRLLELIVFCCGRIGLSWNEQKALIKLILAILVEVAANA